jgi:hypothetical protein
MQMHESGRAESKPVKGGALPENQKSLPEDPTPFRG